MQIRMQTRTLVSWVKYWVSLIHPPTQPTYLRGLCLLVMSLVLSIDHWPGFTFQLVESQVHLIQMLKGALWVGNRCQWQWQNVRIWRPGSEHVLLNCSPQGVKFGYFTLAAFHSSQMSCFLIVPVVCRGTREHNRMTWSWWPEKEKASEKTDLAVLSFSCLSLVVESSNWWGDYIQCKTGALPLEFNALLKWQQLMKWDGSTPNTHKIISILEPQVTILFSYTDVFGQTSLHQSTTRMVSSL